MTNQNEIDGNEFIGTLTAIGREALEIIKMSDDIKISVHELHQIVTKHINGDSRWECTAKFNRPLIEELTYRLETNFKANNLLRAA